MTKFLANVLDMNEQLFAAYIARLEQATNEQGIDIRLTASIAQETKVKIAELGLDPNDTTVAELYRALQLRAQSDNDALLKQLSLDSDASSVQIMQTLVKKFKKNASAQRVVTIKNKALKKLFTTHVPAKTMKVLHYRSAASLLKRENPHELYVLAHMIESDSYKKKLQQVLKNLKAADYEESSLQLVCLKKERWELVRKAIKHSFVPIFSLPEVGTIAVLPISTDKTSCLALLSTALLLKEMRHIKQMATYIKIRMLDPEFHHHAEIVDQQANNELLRISDTPVHWRHVHALLSTTIVSFDFGPHITDDDMQWIHIEAELSGICPDIGFWVGTHRLAYIQNYHVVSLHLVDVCFSVMYNNSLHHAPKQFVKQAIHDELIQLYLAQPPYKRMIHEHITKIADTSAEVLYYEA